jgi:hypothetical protein
MESFAAGRRPGQRHPNIYASASAIPQLAADLTAGGAPAETGLHIAHWGIGMPAAIALLGSRIGGYEVRGVQFARNDFWDSDVWLASWLSDQSVAATSPPPPPPTDWTEAIMAQLPTLRPGDKGPAVRTMQGLLVARGWNAGTTGAAHDGIDGDFGPITEACVHTFQQDHKLTDDGVVGPKTWPVLAGV